MTGYYTIYVTILHVYILSSILEVHVYIQYVYLQMIAFYPEPFVRVSGQTPMRTVKVVSAAGIMMASAIFQSYSIGLSRNSMSANLKFHPLKNIFLSV